MTRKERSKCLLVSTRVVEETAYAEKRSALAYDYVELFESLGYTPILVPANTGNVEAYLSLIHDGVILTGGNTVPPTLGKESTGDVPTGVYPERDQVEQILLEGAIESGVPVLGICRGMQFINGFFGGSTSYGIEGHVAIQHPLDSDNSLIGGQTVNSYHGDGVSVNDMAPSLRVLAATSGPYIEALYHPDLPILGVQWHPERQNCEFDKQFIQQFLTTGKLP